MANCGMMPVDFTALRDFLKLPEGTCIVGVRLTPDNEAEQDVVFLVESEDFPSTPKGQSLPRVDAEFTADEDGNPVFVQWKIEDVD